MAHIITKAEFINQFLNGFPIRSLEDLNLWTTRKTLSETAAFDATVDLALAKINDSFPAPGTTQMTYQNRKLGITRDSLTHNYSQFSG